MASIDKAQPSPSDVALRLARTRPATQPTLPEPLAAPGRVFAYVDNSNVWIEGMRIQAVRKGLARDPYEAITRNITSPWAYDFGRLYTLACPEGSMVGRAFLVGSRPPPNDSVWARAQHEGFQVEVFDRNVAGREKRVDSSIITTMVEDSFAYMKTELGDLAVLVAGDGDYMPPLESLHKRGLNVRVICWKHATSRDLRETADEYLELDPYFDWLTR